LPSLKHQSGTTGRRESQRKDAKPEIPRALRRNLRQSSGRVFQFASPLRMPVTPSPKRDKNAGMLPISDRHSSIPEL
jgi:hypothetical protein